MIYKQQVDERTSLVRALTGVLKAELQVGTGQRRVETCFLICKVTLFKQRF